MRSLLFTLSISVAIPGVTLCSVGHGLRLVCSVPFQSNVSLRWHSLILSSGSFFQTACYAMMIPEGPFAVRVVAYGVGGFGAALQVFIAFLVPLSFFDSVLLTDNERSIERRRKRLRWRIAQKHRTEARDSACSLRFVFSMP